MANLVWTGILYACTMGVVLVCYRAFMQDRRIEQEIGARALVDRVYAKGAARSPAMPAPDKAATRQVPGVKVEPPPWSRSRRA